MSGPAANPSIVKVEAEGQVYDVPKDNLDKFSQGLGGNVHVLSQSEIAEHDTEKRQAQLAKKYGGVGSKIAAAGIGAGDALTFGLGTALAGEIGGEETKQYLREQQEANPEWEIGGNVAGMALPALLTGGGSLLGEAGEGLGTAGRLLGAGNEALAGLGEAAGSIAGRGAESVLGKAAQTGARTALDTALQGGAFGAGQAASEDIINDRDLTAEHLLAGAAKGAGYGALLGGGLGFAGSLAGSAGSAALARLSRAGEAAGEEGGGLVGELGARAAGIRRPSVNRMLDKGIDPTVIGKALVEEAPKYSDKPFMAMTKEDMRDAAKLWAKDIGEQVGAARDDLGRIAEEGGVKPDMAVLGKRIEDEVIAPLRKTPGFEPETKQLEQYLGNLMEKGENATFKDLSDFRKALDTKVFKGGKAPTPDSIYDQLRSVRSIMEEEIENQGADVGGQDWLERYKGAKKQFGIAKEAEDLTEKGFRGEAARNKVGLSDMIIAGAGMAHAGPVGLLAGVAHHVAKEYGMQFAADVLNRASKLQSIQALASAGDKQLQAGVRGFLTGAKQKAPSALLRATIASREQDFKQRSEHIQKLSANPELLVEHIRHTQPPADVAPKLATTYAQKQTQALAWLASQVPKGTPVSPLIPTVHHDPSPQERDKWLEKLAIYDDPIGTITKKLSAGTLTHDDVTAGDAMWPSLMQDLRKKALEQVTEMASEGKSPDFYKAQSLETLGLPALASQDPAFLQQQQMLYSQQNQAASQSVGQPPSTPQHVRGARSSLATGEDSLGET